MAGIPRNPDAPSGIKTPDVFIYISTQPVTTATAQPKNLFLLVPALLAGACMTGAPYNLSAGDGQVNSIEQYTSVDRVNSTTHRRSLAACSFRAALQAVPIGINIRLGLCAEPSNSNFAGVATQLLGFEGTAVGSGEIKARIRGYLHKFSIASGDTGPTAATTAHTAMGSTGGGTKPQQPDCPLVPGAILAGAPLAGIDSVPLVFVHRGEVGNHKPIVVEVPPEITGLKVAVGVLTVGGAGNAVGTAAGAASAFKIRCGVLEVSVSIAIGTTPAQAATLIANAINSATFGLTATAATADVKLYYRSGWAVHKLQVSSTEDALGQTYTIKDRLNTTHAAIDTSVATVPASAAYTALAGSGTPTLTTILSNKAKVVQCIEWATPYLDSTSLGDISQHIETQANGYYQQNQRCMFASDEVLDASGTGLKNAKQRITDPTTPLTNYWRYGLMHAQDIFCGADNMAYQFAADLCATDLPYNMDGHELRLGSSSPMLPGRADTELDANTLDTSMRSYYLTPVKGINGKVVVVRGVTTWAASNMEWADLSYGRCYDDLRYRLRAYLNSQFAGKVLFVGTGPRVANAFTLADVVEATKTQLIALDGITVDGAKSLFRYIVAEVDENDGSWIKLALRNRPPREAHGVTAVISQAPPP